MTINPVISVDVGGATSSVDPSTHQNLQTRQLIQAVQQINQTTTFSEGRELSLSLDPVTKVPVVKVVDAQTREVINQVPAEYVLRIAGFLETQAEEESHAQTLSAHADE
jgi:uncharacterized FlaG/YvyC family protein